MGKRIISQARGHGSMTYRARRKAFVYRIKYPEKSDSEAEILNLVHSTGHSAPLAKMRIGEKIFYNPAFENAYKGQKIKPGEYGSIMKLKDIDIKLPVYNIESNPNDGGKMIRTAGSSAIVLKKADGKVRLLMPSKKEKEFNENCRATLGIIAGSGRSEKPIIKAGKNYYIKKSRNKMWPRTSAVKMNVVDHPFGSGRGKNLTHGQLGKIPRRHSPPGANVGSIRANRTGKSK